MQRILTHIGEAAQPPPIAPVRGPPAWDHALVPLPDWEAIARLEPEYMLDQRVQW